MSSSNGNGNVEVLDFAAARAADEPGQAVKLRLVDPQTGDFAEVDGDPLERIRRLEAELAEATAENEGLVREVRSLVVKLRNAERDRDRAARRSELWPAAVEAFTYWRTLTGRTSRTQMTAERFYLLEPYLKRDGLDAVKLAIDGAAFDPHTADRPNRNGKVERYDSLETIFKHRAAFERHVNRAPRERLRQVRDEGYLAPRYTPLELRLKAEVILALEIGDVETPPADIGERVSAAVERARLELEGRALASPAAPTERK